MYIPSDNLDLRVNGEPVYGYQLKRPVRKDVMSMLTSYNLNYSSLELSIPLNYKSLLFDRADQNTVELLYNGKIIFSGYPAGSSVDYGQGNGTLILNAVPWIGLVSKSYSTYAIGAAKPAALLAEIISDLDARYIVASNVHNDVSGIEIAVNTNGAETDDIGVINSICELLCMGVFLNGFLLEAFMLPETLAAGEELVPGIMVGKQPRFDSITSMDYDKITLTYKNTVGGAEKTVTAGNGRLLKNVSPTNIYMDDASAQNIVDRQYALFSTPWQSLEQAVSKEFKIGDRVSYGGYNFFVYSVEYVYTHWIIKCYGKRSA